MDLEQYVKVLDKTLIHNNYQYKIGINKDAHGGKGLHFCKLKHVIHWLHYGDCIAKVTIPEGTEIKKKSFRHALRSDELIISDIVVAEEHPCWNDEAFCLIVSKTNRTSHFDNIKNPTDEMMINIFKSKSRSSRSWVLKRLFNTKAIQTPELCDKMLEATAELSFHPNIYLEALNSGENVIDYVRRVGKQGKKRKIEDLGQTEEAPKKKTN